MKQGNPAPLPRTHALPLFAALLALLMTSTHAADAGNQTHASDAFDYRRLAGRWFQLAHLKNRHEQDLGNVVAVFAPEDNGAIRFHFRGFKEYGKGKKMSLKGKARTDPRDPARFTVRFYGIFARSFRVVAYDRVNYQYAIMSDESKDCFWLLSRTPDAGDWLYRYFGEVALAEEVDLKELVRTPQRVTNYARQ
jgi:apolipoprotein D and lipocalin family protein